MPHTVDDPERARTTFGVLVVAAGNHRARDRHRSDLARTRKFIDGWDTAPEMEATSGGFCPCVSKSSASPRESRTSKVRGSWWQIRGLTG